jgi:D-alanyl-lipoteichoic acid acyltransferase DltB (MBOAT superfamily)
LVFSSHAFLVFMLVLLAVYGLVSRFAPRHCKATLIAASLVFYGFWIPKYLVLLGLSLAFNYVLSGGLTGPGPEGRKRLLLWIGVTCNLALIGYYKYLDLLIGGLNGVFELSMPLQQIVLPIGISFFTFQQIGYLVDVYEKKTERPSAANYVFFIAFFPQLIAGPIVQQSHFLPQVQAKTDWSLRADHVGLGLALFSMGLFKKTVLADNIGRYSDAIFVSAQTQAIGTLDAWMAAIGYSFQIYFDFSGYSDMAAGLAFLWGFRMPLNFFSPYKADSIIEFWRRWHISLSVFLRDYLYIRLGGNRHGFPRTMGALLATMLLGGLWHGAGLQFIVWGGLHGLFLVVNHCWKRFGGFALHRWLGLLLTYVAVCVAWLYFRATSIEEANRFVAAMFGFGAPTSFTPTSRGIVTFVWLYFLIAWFMPNTVELFARHHIYLPSKAFAAAMERATEARLAYRFNKRWALLTALTFTIGWFAISNLSPFLYFQF